MLKRTLGEILLTTLVVTLMSETKLKDQYEPISPKTEITQVNAKINDNQLSNKKIEINDRYNDLARFLAGMNLREDSEIHDLTFNPDWQEYSHISENKWSKFNSEKKSKIEKWAGNEIPDAIKDGGTVFYPFSGPDILHADIFFPNARDYILFGLEPVGTIPEFEKTSKDSLKSYFDLLNTSIDDALNLSFFRTNDMKQELNNEEIDGTIPILLLFLARTDKEIVNIKPIEINNNGNISYLNKFAELSGEKGYNKGVEISFKAGDKDNLRKLYYFSADLSNSGLSNNSQTRLYLDNMERTTTFIKSASYLMHKSYFSDIRTNILDKSDFILQDDSGIPFRYLDKKRWGVNLYGTYTKPIDMFRNHFEQDLQTAYAENPKPLNFRIGYGKKSNLLVARKNPQ